ncbi:MAG TPA: carboxypeptidase-like regulatory domain-containing protein, partial [Vicinamibacterales bacterium]|nr:carboxypeptidase-like regulatory domain-containing protein [Vicinamibacterales bacterium]
MKKPRLPFILLLIALCACPLAASAQQETATITGSVKDQTGAIVPKATVTVTNTQTNISVKTEADEAGFYIIPSLRPGEYSVTAESSGFQKIIRTGVTLQVAQVARIDLTLQAGALTETVEVVAATPLLDTQTSSRGLVIDEKKIVELPLNGRDYNQL